MTKITEMNREELRDYMRASREILHFDSEAKSWQRAFKLCKAAGNEHLEMECSRCILIVKEWLQK